jgi:hypothetical protein
MSLQTQYITYLLRSLGYDDSKGDFNWSEAVDKAYNIGLISSVEDKSTTNQPQSIIRDDVVAVFIQCIKNKDEGL